jgi:hypothetical protein
MCLFRSPDVEHALRHILQFSKALSTFPGKVVVPGKAVVTPVSAAMPSSILREGLCSMREQERWREIARANEMMIGDEPAYIVPFSGIALTRAPVTQSKGRLQFEA